MNMFHSVVGMWVVENKGFLDFLMMVSKLFNLWSVTFNRSLKYEIINGSNRRKIRGKIDNFYLVDFKFLDLLFKGTVHFKCNSNNFLSLLLNPWTNGVGLLSELESEKIINT